MNLQFRKNLRIEGEIVCETGLHIGGASETIEIGGIDNIIIRDPVLDLPFIPGSSIKGKMRSLVELSDKDISPNIIANEGKPCSCGSCVVCKVFGSAAEQGTQGPTRLIVRDAFPTEPTQTRWKELEPVTRGTEVKWENTLNRITSEAMPRPMERVPKESKFAFEMIYAIYTEEDYENLKVVFHAMKLLEDNYLGGSGTRGYGRIKFTEISLTERPLEYYKGAAQERKICEGKTALDILTDEPIFQQLRGNKTLGTDTGKRQVI